MRVALVVHHVRPTGGQDRYALELARRLAGQCDLDLVTVRAEGDLPSGARLRTVSVPDRPLLVTAPLFVRAARSLLRGERYDVVHTIGGAYPGASVITAQFCHAAWREVNRSPSLYERLVSRQAIAHEREAYRHPSLRALIAVSQRTADEVRHHYGPLAVPVTVIPNAVDATRFAPRPEPRPARAAPPPVLLFVGAYARKGLDTAIRALARLRTPDVLLVAVGDGPRGPYRRLAQNLGVAARVRLEPRTPNVEAFFAEADAFVFPTRYEPFGMVIAEAMASGLPVVTSAAAGAAELVRDGESGLIVPNAEDAGAFAAALDQVLADGARRAAMGRAARDAVLGLTWDMVAERTLAVYQSLA
jgi:glycosyltransferase involved in cell wall biosynthesis